MKLYFEVKNLSNCVENILERVDSVKLVRVERNNLVFAVKNGYERILHVIGLEGKMVGHIIKTERCEWLPTLSDLELLADYFTFLRSLCEVTYFPSEETKSKVLKLAREGVGVVEVCKILYEGEWKDILKVLKNLSTR